MSARNETTAVVMLGLLLAVGVPVWAEEAPSAPLPGTPTLQVAAEANPAAARSKSREVMVSDLDERSSAANGAARRRATANPNTKGHGQMPPLPVQETRFLGEVSARMAANEAPEVVTKPAPTLDIRPMNALSTNIGVSSGALPSQAAAERFATDPAQLVAQNVQAQRVCFWEASLLCHNPLYFDDVNLENFGYSTPFPYFTQPFYSAGKFFTTVPALPYLMTVDPICETRYALGEYRPGNCVPNQARVPPWSAKAAVVEAMAVTGAVFVIP